MMKRVIRKIKKIIKGFTIVELIVVITIVTTLGSIVTVYVVGQLNKAKDSRVKAEITEIAKNIGMYYSDNSTYEGYTLPSGFTSVCQGSSYTLSINGSSAFVVYAKLCASDDYWCTDSTGSVKEIENPPDSGVYSCTSGAGDGEGGDVGGCGSNPACSAGYTCYNDSECIQCNNDGLPNDGEDCRCGDSICGVGDSCAQQGCGEGSYACESSQEVTVRGLMCQLPAAASTYYAGNGNYNNMCNDASNYGTYYRELSDQLWGPTMYRMYGCKDTIYAYGWSGSTQGWVVCIDFYDGLFSNGHYCADYNGFNNTTSTDCYSIFTNRDNCTQ